MDAGLPRVQIQAATPAPGPSTASSSTPLSPLLLRNAPDDDSASSLSSPPAASSSSLSDVDEGAGSDDVTGSTDRRPIPASTRHQPKHSVADKCHRCRSLGAQPGVTLLHCTGTRRFTAAGKPVKVPVRCTTAFCLRCLSKQYGDAPFDAQTEGPAWVCPVCRLACDCYLCRRKRGLLPIGVAGKQVNGTAGTTAVSPRPSDQSSLPFTPAHRHSQAGPSQTPGQGTGRRPRLATPDFVDLDLPPGSPAVLVCLHVREFIFRFRHLMFELGPTGRGSRASNEALAALSDDLVTVWSAESTPRVLLRGLLRLLQSEIEIEGDEALPLDRQRLHLAIKQTRSQPRWGYRCWQTARRLIDSHRAVNGWLAVADADDGPNTSAESGVDDSASDTEPMAVDDDTDDEEARRVRMMARLPPPNEKLRILCTLVEKALSTETVRRELHEGIEAATIARAAIARSKRDAQETRAELKKQVAEAKINMFDRDDVDDLAQRVNDHVYDSRAELAKLYIESTSCKLRFKPAVSNVAGVDVYSPAHFTAASAVPENLSLSCSYAVLAHRAANDRWYTFEGADKIRAFADWLESELRHQQYQLADVAAADHTLQNAASPPPPADLIAPLRSFADFVEFKLVYEPAYADRRKERRGAYRQGRQPRVQAIVQKDGHMKLL